MRVFIAEKPQLAQVIAEALGSPHRQGGYIQSGPDVVTWCIGHLLQLAPPEVHNPAYKNWVATDLPLKLRPQMYQPIAKTVSQLEIVGQLIGKATEIVHAGDPDDEGQLLVEEVLEYYGNTAPVKRILINDLNANAARKALEGLRDNREFFGLYQKALARSIGDQLYGFNMTRACTLAAQAKGVKGVLSVGRVQTPILGLIVNRYLANKGHAGAFYYTVAASLAFAFGRGLVKPRLVVAADAPVDDKNRLIDEQYANQVADACRQKQATVTQASVVEKQAPAPLPFALLDLQVYMSKEHGIDAEKTLELTQALREKYKAITYNRSDCSYLSDEQFAEAPHTLELLSLALPDMVGLFSEVESERKSRAFDESKVSAHTAIIPTSVKIDVSQLSADERAVYLAIVKRYVIQFLPEKRYLSAEVRFEVSGHTFLQRATKVTHPGWAAQVQEEPEEEDEGDEGSAGAGTETAGTFEALADLKVNDQGVCDGVTVAKEKTKPLPLYTEATLLKDLQRVAKYVKDPRIKQLLIARDHGKKGENGGIGTPATRAAMLAKLQERGFYKVDKKKLIPTQLGLEFIAALPAIATTPDMSALWHEQQQMIEAGELTVDAFLDELEGFIAGQVGNVDLSNVQIAPQLSARCPMCGEELVVTTRQIGCRGCQFKLYPEIAGKMLTLGQIEALLTKGKTGVLKGFKTKAGKPFEAALKLNHEAKVEFVSNR